jgi:plasmid stability protein
MTDLLIRNVGAHLKRRLEKRARANNRSLSEEAKILIQRALAAETENRKLGTLMSELLPIEDRSDDYVFEAAGDISRPPDL